MATKAQIRKRFREISKQAHASLNEYCERALNSEIDFSEAPDDYEVPKQIMCAALKELGYQYVPFYPPSRKKVKEISAKVGVL